MKNKTKKIQFELEKQLHEQYAINNNASIGSFVSFIGSLFALFGVFGYAYVYSSIDFSENGVLIVDGFITLDTFLLFSIIINGVLFFLAIISLYLGYSNRINQVIIDRIRDKYFKKKNKAEIFENAYSPTDKNKFTFVQDYFNHFYWLFFTSQILVFCFSLKKICFHISVYKNHNFYIKGCLYVFLVVFIQVILISCSYCFRSKYYRKYQKKQKRTFK